MFITEMLSMTFSGDCNKWARKTAGQQLIERPIFYKTNRFESIRLKWIGESIRIANRNALLTSMHEALKYLKIEHSSTKSTRKRNKMLRTFWTFPT